MKKIFLDIGSHIGQTLEEVEQDYYNFDEIHSFEPSSQNYDTLCKNFNKKNIYLQANMVNMYIKILIKKNNKNY